MLREPTLDGITQADPDPTMDADYWINSCIGKSLVDAYTFLVKDAETGEQSSNAEAACGNLEFVIAELCNKAIL